MNLEHKTNHVFGQAMSSKLEGMPPKRDVTNIGSFYHTLTSDDACGMPLN
jgi:hypothetical protein